MPVQTVEIHRSTVERLESYAMGSISEHAGIFPPERGYLWKKAHYHVLRQYKQKLLEIKQEALRNIDSLDMTALTKQDLELSIAQLELRLSDSLRKIVAEEVANVEKNVKGSLIYWIVWTGVASVIVLFGGFSFMYGHQNAAIQNSVGQRFELITQKMDALSDQIKLFLPKN